MKISSTIVNPDDKTCSCCNQPLTGTEHFARSHFQSTKSIDRLWPTFSKMRHWFRIWNRNKTRLWWYCFFLKEEHSKKKILNKTGKLKKHFRHSRQYNQKRKHLGKEKRASKSCSTKMMFTTLENYIHKRNVSNHFIWFRKWNVETKSIPITDREGLSNSLHDIDYGKLNGAFQKNLKHQGFDENWWLRKDSIHS